MYPNEVLFVDKFLSELVKMKVKNIPFRTEKYRKGVSAMKLFFDDHADEIDPGFSDIRLLFLNGGQKNFAMAIMNANGNQISLQNPKLERANVCANEEWANQVLDDDTLSIPNSFIEGITRAFCEAAGVSC